MVKVKLEGLKIVRARGKYYVYHRASGEALLKSFDGDREALGRKLAEPEFIGAYNARRKRTPKSYPEKTLGWLVHWYTNDCLEFERLSDETKGEYKEALSYLEPEYDAPLDTITQPSLYVVRDQCAKDKWPHFADRVIKTLSTMFTRAMRRGKMPANPAMGIEKAHKTDPNSNREWRPEEWTEAFNRAPAHFRVLMMLARHVGYRGQTLIVLQWKNYQPDPAYGKCFRVKVRKNSEPVWIPASPDLQAFLDDLKRTSLNIATRSNGTPWEFPKQMQTAFSNWLKPLERAGIVGIGLTLHGLRVTYAAGLRREGANASDVAAALGDRDERMGEHYTRHVENEARVIRAFGKPKKRRPNKK